MKITWIGHSCFKIENNGYSLIIDPYADGTVPGLLPVRETANQVVCSHQHPDHYAPENITITPSAGTPFGVTALDTFHDEVNGSQRGRNIIHLIESGEYRAAHLGDLGCIPTKEQLEILKNVDVLMIPVGGFFTIDAQQAKKLVDLITPKTILPMHYRDDIHGFGYDVIESVTPFLEYFDHVSTVSDSSIEVGDDNAAVVNLRPSNCCQ